MIRHIFLGASILVAAAASPLWPATVQDPNRPVILGPDARLLGDRDMVTLTRWADAPGDPEPLYLVAVDGVEAGFARDGDQCWSAKFGGEIVPCEGALAREIATAEAIGATNNKNYADLVSSAAQPDWAVTPPPTIIDGGTIYVTVPDPTPGAPEPVPVPAAIVLLLSALAGLIVRVSL